jgi:pyridoxine 4-dehydrogenase
MNVRYRRIDAASSALRRAASEHPIADLQIEYSLIVRLIEQQIMPHLRDIVVAITAYGVLGRRLISGLSR